MNDFAVHLAVKHVIAKDKLTDFDRRQLHKWYWKMNYSTSFSVQKLRLEVYNRLGRKYHGTGT